MKMHMNTVRIRGDFEKHETYCGIDLETNPDTKSCGYYRNVTCRHCRGRFVKERRKQLQMGLDGLNHIVEFWSNDEVGFSTPKRKGK